VRAAARREGITLAEFTAVTPVRLVGRVSRILSNATPVEAMDGITPQL
jgi:hypothetical protein